MVLPLTRTFRHRLRTSPSAPNNSAQSSLTPTRRGNSSSNGGSHMHRGKKAWSKSLLLWLIPVISIITLLWSFSSYFSSRKTSSKASNSDLPPVPTGNNDVTDIPLPPPGTQMGLDQIRLIRSSLGPHGNLLVWGLGNDSPYWHNATTGRVVFLEDDVPFEKDGVLWYDTIMAKYPYLEAYKVHYTTDTVQSYETYVPTGLQDHLGTIQEKEMWSQTLDIRAQLPPSVRHFAWDVIVVDAPLGCCNAGPGRYQSLYTTWALATTNAHRGSPIKEEERGVHVFVDDFERKVERNVAHRFWGKEEQVVTRGVGASNANEQALFRMYESRVKGRFVGRRHVLQDAIRFGKGDQKESDKQESIKRVLFWGVDGDSSKWIAIVKDAIKGMESEFQVQTVFLDTNTEEKSQGCNAVKTEKESECYSVQVPTSLQKMSQQDLLQNTNWKETFSSTILPEEVQSHSWDVIVLLPPDNIEPTKHQSQAASFYLALYHTLQLSHDGTHVFINDYPEDVGSIHEATYTFLGAPHVVHSFDKTSDTLDADGVVPTKRRLEGGASWWGSQITSSLKRTLAEFIITEKDLQWRSRMKDRQLSSSLQGHDNKKEEESSSYVIVLTVNEGFLDFFLNWYQHYVKLKLSNDVVVIAEDEAVYTKLEEATKNFAQVTVERSQLIQGTSGNGKQRQQQQQQQEAQLYDSELYHQLVSTRAAHLLRMMEKHHPRPVLYVDVDTVWKKNPFPSLLDSREKENASSSSPRRVKDVVMQIEDPHYTLYHPYYCTGWIAISSNTALTQKLMFEWDAKLRRMPQLNQPVYNQVLYASPVVHGGVPREIFPNGREYFEEFSDKKKEEVVVVHNNYIVGKGAKEDRFRGAGLWLV